MKVKDSRNEFRSLSRDQILLKVYEYRSELLKLKLQMITNPAKDFVSKKRELKKGIARGLTIFRESFKQKA